MSTDADLAALGEPAAAALEEVLAEFLDRALEAVARGEVVDTALLLQQAPGLWERGDRLVEGLRALHGAARSVWEHSGLLDETAGDPTSGPGRQGPPPDPFPGEFRVERWLGEGTFGEVWLAEDLHLGRPVALKFLRVGPDGAGREQALAVLRNDARLLAAVSHPNVLKVYAWRQTSGPAPAEHCLVLQFVAGGSLRARVERDGPLPWPKAARYIADVADGLLATHARGIVHRDVKPANILLDPDADEALLTDFGIAARLSDRSGGGGTPFFMAPEAFGGVVGIPQDVYGLAASLFWLVSGDYPFPAHTRDELLRRIERGLPEPDPRCAGLPQALEQVVRAGLHARPERRPALADFARALRGSLNLLMADTLPLPVAGGGRPPVNLRLTVSREAEAHTHVPVAATPAPAERFLRDIKRVPAAPKRVTLQTGDRVRLEVEADRPGYVTVFNVGPTGNLNLLYPAEPEELATPSPLAANRPLHVLDVELTPPAGPERLVALWSREPLPLRLDELLALVEPVAGPYRATRDMARVQESWRRLPPEDRHAMVLELDHR